MPLRLCGLQPSPQPKKPEAKLHGIIPETQAFLRAVKYVYELRESGAASLHGRTRELL